MPRGKATIRFIGGVLDGEIQEDVAAIYLTDKIRSFTGVWIRVLPDETAQVMKGGKPDSFWQSYNEDVYEKQLERDNSNSIVYKFIEKQIVNRCKGTTKKGTRCLKPTKNDEAYCPQHRAK